MGYIRRVPRKKKSKARFVAALLMALFLAAVTVLFPPVTAEDPDVSPLWNGTTASAFAGGTGSETDPYRISTGEQLAYFSQQVNGGNNFAGKYIVLTRSILLNEMNEDGSFVSGSPKQFNNNIGNAANHFDGYFDGAGYEIIGLHINIGWVEYKGLFGYAGTASEISNLKISGSITGSHYTGGVAGYTNGLISGCTVSCSIATSWNNYHGGIVGYAGTDSVISNCSFTGDVIGAEFVGGIAGYTGGKIIGCDADADVSGWQNAGGIVGYAAGNASEINNCTFSGSITATGGNNIGGIAGQLDGAVISCTVNATITSTNEYVGGIAGKANTGSTIKYSSFSGSISAKVRYVGGIAGYSDGEISICINTGDVFGGSGSTGGIVGSAGDNCEINNCFNSGSATSESQSDVGGIVGHVSSGTQVHHNLNVGEVNGVGDVGSVIGGIDGDVSGENVYNNYYYDYEGAPTGTSDDDIEDNDGAVPVGDMTWEDIWDLLNEDNQDEEGNDIWGMDDDEEEPPKPGGGGPSPGAAFRIETAAVQEGKYYSAGQLAEAGTAVEVTADSVFTVLFNLEYKQSCAPGGHTLRLKSDSGTVQFPAGTAIIMLAEGSYYYINLTEDFFSEGGAVVTLGDFIKMGSDDTADCYSPEGKAVDDEAEYLFIFDFTKTADAAENVLPAASYNIELLHPAGGYSGTPPAVTVTGKNSYELSVNAVDDLFTIKLQLNEEEGEGEEAPAPGYDYKTDGKVFACELYLEELAGGEMDFPAGSKIRQPDGSMTFISSDSPYAFLQIDLEQVAAISLDMSECELPLVSGSYILNVAAYAAADPLNPRGGFLLAKAQENITLSEPVTYAIKATIGNGRVFNQSTDPIPVQFGINTIGSNNVQSTLQRKYGKVYEDVDQPAYITGGQATLHLPADSPKGTYRFVLTLRDGSGTERARTVKNVIIKEAQQF